MRLIAEARRVDGTLEEQTFSNDDGTGEVHLYDVDGETLLSIADETGDRFFQAPADPTPEADPVVQQQAEQALAGMVIAISEDPNVSETTRAWAVAWRQTVGV